jgi:hypothetical protein
MNRQLKAEGRKQIQGRKLQAVAAKSRRPKAEGNTGCKLQAVSHKQYTSARQS